MSSNLQNPFDQFDELGSAEEANPFDQFDTADAGIKKPFLDTFGKRVYARGQQSVGGAIEGMGDASRLRQWDRAHDTAAVEEAYRKRGAGGALVSSFANYGIAGPAGYGVDKVVEAVDSLIPDTDIEDTFSEVGRGMGETGAINLAEAGDYGIRRPDSIKAEPGQAAKYYGAQFAESMVGDVLPALAIGYINPPAGLSAMGAKVWGEEYHRLRAQGVPEQDAQEQANFRAAAEVGPELVPFGMALKPIAPTLENIGSGLVNVVNRTMASKTGSMAAVGVAEAVSEDITELANILYDKYRLDKDITFDEFQARMKDAAVVGFGMGAGMRGTAMSLEAADAWVKKTFGKEAPPEGDLGDNLNNNPGGGGFDLHQNKQINGSAPENLDLNQAPEFVQGEDGQRMDPLDLGGDQANPFDKFDDSEPAIAPENVIGRPRPSATAAPVQTAPAESNPQTLGFEVVDPLALEIDPQTFQYKEGGDEQGVLDTLKTVRKWDDNKAGTILVYEYADGRRVVADGHQRAGLARRLVEQGKATDPRIMAKILRQADGYTPEDARRIAAEANIAQGSGTAVDAAKVLRVLSPEDQAGALETMPVGSAIVRDAVGLAKLSDTAFMNVVNQQVTPAFGALIGGYFDEPEKQEAAMQVVIQHDPSSADQVRAMLEDLSAAGFHRSEQGGLFGESSLESLLGERSKILANSVSAAKKDKSLFKRLVENEGQITKTGQNRLDSEANLQVLSETEILAHTLIQSINTTPELNGALNDVAAQLKSGQITTATATKQFLAAARAYLETGGRIGVERPGDEGNAPEAPEADQGIDLFGQPVSRAPEADSAPTEAPEPDMFGINTSALQQAADAERTKDEKRSGKPGVETVPVEAGDGALFAGGAGQQDFIQGDDGFGNVDKPGSNLFVEWGGKRYPVASIDDAQDKWNKFRDASGAGASDIGSARVIDETGKETGKISYNGQYWPAGAQSAAPSITKTGTELPPALQEIRKGTIAFLNAINAKGATPDKLIKDFVSVKSKTGPGIAIAVDMQENAGDLHKAIENPWFDSAWIEKWGETIEQAIYARLEVESKEREAAELPGREADLAHHEEMIKNRERPDFWKEPVKTVETAKIAGPFITPKEAETLLDSWKAEALRIGREEDHSNEVILSLFDFTGHWSQPYVDAGYDVIRWDIKNGDDLLYNLGEHLYDIENDIIGQGKTIVGVLCATPCTSYASSGARWWKDVHTTDKVVLDEVEKRFGAKMSEYFSSPLEYNDFLVLASEEIIGAAKPKFFALENPRGRIRSRMKLPDPTMIFQPHHFGDPYTKETFLYGTFDTSLPFANVFPKEGSKIQSKLSSKQKTEREMTPEGFAYAFFMANSTARQAQTVDVDAAAHQAATSPKNDLPQPTKAQKEAGNYQKGHLILHGLDITIENPIGSIRKGKGWEVRMKDHYGYIKGTEGNDGDHVDVFLGPNAKDVSPLVAIVDQRAKDGSFDEHKVIIGYEPGKAEQTYLRNYTKDFKDSGAFAALTEISLDELKDWIATGNHKAPYSDTTFAKERDDENVSRQETGGDTERGQDLGQLQLQAGQQSRPGSGDQAGGGTPQRGERGADGQVPGDVGKAGGGGAAAPVQSGAILSTEAQNESTDSGKPGGLEVDGKPPLEGTLPEDVQGTAGSRPASESTGGRSEPDRQGNGSDDGRGLQLSPSLGSNPGAVPVAAAGTEPERGSEGDGQVLPDPAGNSRGTEKDRRDAVSVPDLDQEPTGSNYVITAADDLGSGGAKTKFKDNVAAIRALKGIEGDGHTVTPEDQRSLARYVGWGGLPQAFEHPTKGITAGWEKEVVELRSLLTPQELKAAAASTLNAHYTSLDVINGMYQAIERLGFRGGRVLEPAVGTGNFFGLMPAALKSKTSLIGVELDSLTGRIAQNLYPNSKIHVAKGFEEVVFQDNSFDLAIGNPPFGNYAVHDPNEPDVSGWSIHNYFFGKSIKKVKPGGILAMVVSRFLMDSMNSSTRQYLADQADLIGAIRLPNTAFKQNALTEVVTDIIFLQKRAPGAPSNGVKWTGTTNMDDPQGGNSIVTSEYFAANPHMMLGTWERLGKMQRRDEPTLTPNTGTTLADQIEFTVRNYLPENIFNVVPEARARLESPVPNADVEVDAAAKIYGFFVKDGVVHRRLPDVTDKDGYTKLAAEPVNVSSVKAVERIKDGVVVRDALNALLSAEINPASQKSDLDALRKELNKQYDRFVRSNGYFHDSANLNAMRDDPDIPRLLALETNYEKAISAETARKTGEKASKSKAGKAAIFTRPVAMPPIPPNHAESAADALLISLNESGRINMAKIAKLIGKSEQDAAAELIENRSIFMDPVEGYVTRDEYLSGNVKRKLAEANHAAQEDVSFFANVQELTKIQPADIEAVDISTKMTSPWIPADTMREYIKQLSGANSTYKFVPALGRWEGEVSKPPSGFRPRAMEFATNRMAFSQILESALQDRQIRITDPDPTSDDPEKRVVNKEATLEANQKRNELQEDFTEWLWADQERRDSLVRAYNDKYNTQVELKFDGSFLQFPGMNISVKLEEHQRNGVWRLIRDGYGLMDHTVGAGKTFLAIAAAMEKKRMGLTNKPMIVVPNHLVEQWAKDVAFLYPNANVLAASKKDFEKANRQVFLAKIATGNWDAVVIAHSSFEKIATAPEDKKVILERDKAMIIESMLETEREAGKKDRTFKELQKLLISIEAKLDAASKEKPKDGFIVWRELGIDDLTVDEAHEFKNLFFATRRTRLAGLNSAGSLKAFDLYVKTEVARSTTGGKRGVTFLTGTPISNSIAEMYTMFRYVAPYLLRERGIEMFDAWAAQFAEIAADWELDATGQKYTLKERLRKFGNVPELMALYKTFADTITLPDLMEMKQRQGHRWPVPKIRGGKPQNVIVPRSAAQAAYMDEIVERATAIMSGSVDPKDDNMLKITNDARLSALDIRLKVEGAPDDPDSKPNTAVRRIKEIYTQWNSKKGTQLVFCDLSTPKSSRTAQQKEIVALIEQAKQGDERAIKALEKVSPDDILALQSKFSVYDDMREKLIASGIPEAQIAFIHDYNTDLRKAELFASVRSGKIRILFGSTSKMGAGMNVQNKLVALHHLDAPWRPSDLAQREGRIIRRGNEFFEADPDNFEIDILRYSVEAVYDARMWQIIEAKAKFVEQLYAGATGREIDDVTGEAANAAEMKAIASGNPLMLEQVQLTTAIAKLEMAAKTHKRRVHQAQSDVARLEANGGPDNVFEQAVRHLRAKIAIRDANPPPEEFSLEVGGTVYTKQHEAGEAIEKEINAYNVKRMLDAGTPPRKLFRTHGFDAYVGQDRLGFLSLYLEVPNQSPIYLGSYFKKDEISGSGILTRVENRMADLDHYSNELEAQRQKGHEEIKVKREAAARVFKGQQELQDKKVRLKQVMDILKAEDKKPGGEQPGEVNEPPVIYSGYERETLPVAAKRGTYDSGPQLAFDLQPPADVSAARDQLADNFNTLYRHVPVAEFKVGVERVTTPEEAAHVFSAIRKNAVEVLYALILDKDDKILDLQKHSMGTRAGAAVYPEVVIPSIVAVPGSAKVYFAHNHPSGEPSPSTADVAITRRLLGNMRGSGVDLIGHIVIGRGTKAAYFNVFEPGPGSLNKEIAKGVAIVPRLRKLTVPVTERRVRRNTPKNAPDVSTSSSAYAVVSGLKSANAVLLLNNKNVFIGSLALSEQEMLALRDTGAVRRILSAIDQTNASAVIIKAATKAAANNINRYLAQSGTVQVLDAFIGDARYGALAAGEMSNGMDKPWFHRAEVLDLGFGRTEARNTSVKGTSNHLTKQLEAAIALFTGRTIKPGTYTQVDTPKTASTGVAVVKQVFGKRVVFFGVNGETPIDFNGVTLPRDPNTLYVNIRSHNPFMGVVGHELTHALEEQEPELYKQLADLAIAHMKPNGFADFKERTNRKISENPSDRALSDEKILSEMVANVVGDAFLDEGFIDELARQDKNFLQRLIAAIVRILKSFQAKLKGRGMGSGKYFNDIEGLIAKVQNVLKNHQGKRPAAAPGRALLNPAPAFQQAPANDTFYSALVEAVEAAEGMPKKGQPAAFRQWLDGQQRKGNIKQEERDWMGVDQWLDGQETVTREALQEFVAANQVQVEETILSDAKPLQEYLPEGWKIAEKDDGFVVQDENGVDQTIEFLTANEAMSDWYSAMESMGGNLEDRGGTRYGDQKELQLPGGENYRELLLRLPEPPSTFDPNKVEIKRHHYSLTQGETSIWYGGEKIIQYGDNPTLKPGGKYEQRPESYWMDVARSLYEKGDPIMKVQQRSSSFRAGHYDQPNVLAHVRFNERTDADGKRVLFIEEIQSDWHQQGRKRGYMTKPRKGKVVEKYPSMWAIEWEDGTFSGGYGNRGQATQAMLDRASMGGVPDAPFKKSWPMLAVKRMIRWAAENDFDSIAWTAGQQQTDRYDLSKQIDRIRIIKTGNAWAVNAWKDGDKAITQDASNDAELANIVGKELADSAIKDGGGEYSGLDLKVGGEGMKGFYDKILPAEVNKYVKKWGGKVGQTYIGNTAYGVHDRGIFAALRWQVVSRDKNTPSGTPYETEAEARSQAEKLNRETADTIPVHSLDITPAMREAALAGAPMFSRQYSPEEQEFMRKAGMDPQRKSIADRARDLLATSWSDAKRELSEQIQFGLFDKFYGIKKAERDQLGGNIPHNESAYIAARLSTGAASVMRGVLLYGAPEYRDGIIQKIPGTEGLLDVFAPVKDELDDYLGWSIANRASRLMTEGKENNFTDDDIQAGIGLAAGNMPGSNQLRSDVYQGVADKFAEFKRRILDLAEQAGLIDATTRPVWDKADWIPFYRISGARKEGGVSLGKGMGLSHQTSGIKKLKGGEDALSDPLGNIIMNFTHLIQASMKNVALLKAVNLLAGTPAITKEGWKIKPVLVPKEQVERMLQADGIPDQVIDMLKQMSASGDLFEGIAKMWALAAPAGKEVVRVMVNGKPEYYRVNDPMLLKSLTNVDIEALQGLFRPLRGAKTLLTTMVTSDPAFMARNFTRDALAAWVINEDHFRPGIDSVKGMVKAALENGGMLDMMFAGGSFQGGFINGTDPDSARKSVRQALRAKGFSNEYIEKHLDTVIDTTAGLWDRWRRVGDAVENANREAVYEAARKAGKTKAQAVFEAKDLMDFSMHGSWRWVQMLNDMLPFFNARLQGLYKLGRSGAIPVPGLIAKEIAMKGLWIAVMSMILAWLNDDDEEYEALEDWDKDAYWHVFPGTAFHTRIPKPFEVGILYGTIPERIYRALAGDDTWGKFWSRMGASLIETMAINPIPQLLRPGIEVYANRSMFTGRPIESQGDENKLKQARYNSQTSDTMVAIGPLLEEIGLSPKQAEFMVRGYFGTLGSYALMAADVIVRDMQGKPAVPAGSAADLPVIGSFYRGNEPAWNTRYGTELYEMHREVTELWSTVKSYQAEGDKEKANALLDEGSNRDELLARKALGRWAEQRSTIRKQIDAIYANETLTPDQKRDKINALLVRRNSMDEKVYKHYSPMFGRK